MSKLLHQTRKLFGTKGVKKDELGTGVHAQKGSLWDGHLPTAHSQSPKKAVVDEKGVGHKSPEHNEGSGTESTNPAPLPSPHHEIHQLVQNIHSHLLSHDPEYKRSHDAIQASKGPTASEHHNLDADQGAEN
jgi:hypothetical protein